MRARNTRWACQIIRARQSGSTLRWPAFQLFNAAELTYEVKQYWRRKGTVLCVFGRCAMSCLVVYCDALYHCSSVFRIKAVRMLAHAGRALGWSGQP